MPMAEPARAEPTGQAEPGFGSGSAGHVTIRVAIK
jgi:hypothetical protein